MSTRTIAAAIAAGIVLYGCAQVPLAPRDAPWVACSTTQPGAHCDVRITANPQGKYACEAGRFDVEPDYLKLEGSRPVVLSWRLDGPYRFCDGDDAFLKPGWDVGSTQRFETFRSEKEDGARAGHGKVAACTPVRNWTWQNEPSSAGSQYRYGLRFRNTQTGVSCTIDPWYMNG
jgi:hypothetical protein